MTIEDTIKKLLDRERRPGESAVSKELKHQWQTLQLAHDAVEVQNKRLSEDLNRERAESARLRDQIKQLNLDILAMARAFQFLTTGT